MSFKPKGVHTSPDKAGSQNLPEKLKKRTTLKPDEENVIGKLLPMFDKATKLILDTNRYEGQWTDELLAESINDYFHYVFENDLKPSQSSMALWLATSPQQIWEWKKFPAKYGRKSEIINMAVLLIESQYINHIEKYPTGNMFLLRTSHGHIETSKMDVTTNGENFGASAEDVRDLVDKLGLSIKK